MKSSVQSRLWVFRFIYGRYVYTSPYACTSLADTNIYLSFICILNVYPFDFKIFAGELWRQSLFVGLKPGILYKKHSNVNGLLQTLLQIQIRICACAYNIYNIHSSFGWGETIWWAENERQRNSEFVGEIYNWVFLVIAQVIWFFILLLDAGLVLLLI